MKVGLPRALLFHQYGECWLAFLERLGVEPVVSEATTGSTVRAGAARADNETCFPVKVFTGHILALKGAVDAVLVPRVVSEEPRTCSCPKFLGLPDMARSLDQDLPPVLAPVMDLADGRCLWAREWYETARALGAGRSSGAAAVARMLRDLKLMDGHRMRNARTVEKAPGGREERVSSQSGRGEPVTVGVAGHQYNVLDRHVSHGLLERMVEMGARPVTVEEVDRRETRRQARSLPRRIFWGFESRLAGAALHWSRTRAVSGILFVTSFACGPGSMVGALLEDELTGHGGVPLMTVTLDEHTAEAGLLTRLEAFIDMLRRTPC